MYILALIDLLNILSVNFSLFFSGLWVGWPGIRMKETDVIPESDPSDTCPTAGLKSSQVSCVNLVLVHLPNLNGLF